MDFLFHVAVVFGWFIGAVVAVAGGVLVMESETPLQFVVGVAMLLLCVSLATYSW